MSILEYALAKKMFGGTGSGESATPSGSGILEVDELPTENIDTNAFYLCNGEYYRCQEGKGNNWVFNEVLTMDTGLNCSFAFEFEGYADTKNGIAITFGSYGGTTAAHIKYITDLTEPWGSPKAVVVYAFNEDYNGTTGWLNDEYRNVTIPELPLDESFLNWLNANARPSAGWVKLAPAPKGAMLITTSGDYDVTDKASVVVDIGHPILKAPIISLNGDTLLIANNTQNGNFVESYDIYNSGEFVSNIRRYNYTIDDSVEYDVSTLLTEYYEFTVKAKGTNFKDSENSSPVAAVVGRWVCNNTPLDMSYLSMYTTHFRGVINVTFDDNSGIETRQVTSLSCGAYRTLIADDAKKGIISQDGNFVSSFDGVLDIVSVEYLSAELLAWLKANATMASG